jgi:hypothetical protein
LSRAVLDAKKKAVPRGRIPERGIEPVSAQVKVVASAGSSEKLSNNNCVALGCYFTTMLRAILVPSTAALAELFADNELVPPVPENGTGVLYVIVSTYDFPNIRLNIMKT